MITMLQILSNLDESVEVVSVIKRLLLVDMFHHSSNNLGQG